MKSIFEMTSPIGMKNGGDITDIKIPKKPPQLSGATASTATVLDAVGEGDLVRNTTRIKNLLNGSKVTRDFGYKEVFEVFKNKKSGITRAQIDSFKDVPKIENFIKEGELDSNKYNKAFKKFNKEVLSKLDKEALQVLRSSGYLADYAQDSRISILEKGLEFGKDKKVLRDAKGLPIIKKGYSKVISINPKNGLPVIKKTFESQYLKDNFDYVFSSPKSAEGVKGNPKFQSKVFTDIQNWGKKNLAKSKQFALDVALAQIDKLPGKAKTAALTSLIATIGKSGFALGAKAVPGLNVISAAYDAKTYGPDVLSAIGKGVDTVTEPVTNKLTEAEGMFENMLKSKMNMNQGGIMDINQLTRKLR